MKLAADRTHPAMQPARFEPAIDIEHLARMTMGEPGLDHEVLILFERQAGIAEIGIERNVMAVRLEDVVVAPAQQDLTGAGRRRLEMP